MERSNRGKEFISIIKRSEAAKVYIKDITYIESEARKIHIHTADAEYSVYRKLDEIADILPENFYRCHKSCIINLEKVINMKDRFIYFECGACIAICADKYAKAVQTYKGYLIKHEKNDNT
ncbi:MAG: LytTR family transcriptional regulator [Firmicutes bacterium]|nr:LytTR family transcriptional regulator [Bacillota bacterium]